MDALEKLLAHDETGMDTYEYLVNHEGDCMDQMDLLIDNLKRVDRSGQFLASSARFLNAVDNNAFAPWIPQLIESAIDKDKDRKYIGALLESIWGKDYEKNANELIKTDDNFRRIYKRLFPHKMNGSLNHQI